jgi:hypothetical protein
VSRTADHVLSLGPAPADADVTPRAVAAALQ